MALTPFNDNIQINAPKSLDAKYTKFSGGLGVPFTDTTEANSAVLSAYRHRGLTQLILDAGVATEYWYRDGITNGDLIPKGATISTADTASLTISGIGSLSDPLSGDVQISSSYSNAIKLLTDGLYVPQIIKQGVVYGGIVTWLQNYDYNISAAGYYINGVFYTSPSFNVTLSTPDGTFNRIDTFIVDNTGTPSILEGTPSADPAQAPLDPATQLQLSFALVETGTTQPTIGSDCIYTENTEWIVTSNPLVGTVIPGSTSSPCNGTKSIEATGLLNGSTITLTRSTPLIPDDFTILKFSIRSKGAFGGAGKPKKRKLILQFRNGGTNVGTSIEILNGSYGFSDTNTVDCQIVAIPVADLSFLLTSTVDNLLISIGGQGIIPGFWLDDICFQGVPIPPPPVTTSLTLTTNSTSGAATLIGDVLNIPVYSDTNFATNDLIATADRTHSFTDKILTIANNNGSFILSPSAAQFGIGGSNIFIQTSESSLNSTTFPYSSNVRTTGVGTSFLSYRQDTTYGLEAVFLENIVEFKRSSDVFTTPVVQDLIFNIRNLPSATTSDVVYYNSSTGQLTYGAAPSGGSGFTTADNGLTANTSSNVRLGGTLLANTTVNSGGFIMSFTGANAATKIVTIQNTGGSDALYVESISSGIAITANAINNSAIRAYSESNGTITAIVNPTGGASTASTTLSLIKQTQGTPANGIGNQINFYIQDDAGQALANQLVSKLTNVTDATRTSQFEIWGVNSAVSARKMAIKGNGDIVMDGLRTFADDAAADADTTLESKSLYKVTGSRVVYQKP